MLCLVLRQGIEMEVTSMNKIGAGIALISLIGAGSAEAAVQEQVFLPEQEAQARRQLSEQFEYAKKEEPVKQQEAEKPVQQSVQKPVQQSVQKPVQKSDVEYEQVIPADQLEQARKQMAEQTAAKTVQSQPKAVPKVTEQPSAKKEFKAEKEKITIASPNLQNVTGYEETQKLAITQMEEKVGATHSFNANTEMFNSVNHKEIGVVSVIGNQAVPREMVFRSISLRPGMKLEEADVRKDMQAIASQGWYKDVTSLFAEKDGKAVVVYKVKENPVLRGVNPQGITLVNKPVLDKLFGVGKMFNFREAQSAMERILADYKKNGYVFATPVSMNIRDDGILDLVMSEGIVEDIKVNGIHKTKPNTVLREMRLKQGDVINSKLVQRSMHRLYALDIFDDVEINAEKGSKPGYYILNVELDEGNNATINIGAAYSRSNGLVGTLTLKDKNLTGHADTGAVTFEFDGEDHNKNYDVSYTRPWLDKKETMMNLRIFDNTHSASDYDRDGDKIADYDRKRVGQEITFSRAMSEYTRTYLSFKHSRDTYKGPDGGGRQYYEPSFDPYLSTPGSPYYQYNGKWPATADERRKENFGEVWSVGLSHVYDSRDNPNDTRSGKRMEYSVEQGFGDFTYTKFDADFRYYYPMGKNVLAWDTEVGYAFGKMPLSRRFRVGGSNFLRGYEDDQFRGNSLFRTSLEYRIPLAKIVTGILFTDVGYAWDKRDETQFGLDRLKLGYGLGLRLKTPIGPVKLDYGFGSQHKKGKFYFSFGGTF